ncbi:MAG: DUF3021 family protein [Erysipelotrichaceae bacterium]|nr:DUF3021 family protein [Erysipelotrichaceae bacterium]
MKKIRECIKWFLYITSCILIVRGGIYYFTGDINISKAILDIIIMGILTTLVTMFIFSIDIDSHWGYLIHYVLLIIIVLLYLEWNQWPHIDLNEIVIIIVAVAIVYLLVLGSYYLIDAREAKEINEKLKDKYGNK